MKRNVLATVVVVFCAIVSLACVAEGAGSAVGSIEVAKTVSTPTPKASQFFLPGDLVVYNDQIGVIGYSPSVATFELNGKYYVYPYEGSWLKADWYEGSSLLRVGRLLPGELAN
jgi:hypothetical protein